MSRTENHSEPSEEVKEKIRNELKNFAAKHFEKGFDYMVCGHYHLNEIIDVGKGKLAVLGDWQDQPSYAVFDGKGLTLHQWGMMCKHITIVICCLLIFSRLRYCQKFFWEKSIMDLMIQIF